MKDKKQDIQEFIKNILHMQIMNIESIRNGLDCIERSIVFFQGYFDAVPNPEEDAQKIDLKDFEHGLSYSRSKEDEERSI